MVSEECVWYEMSNSQSLTRALFEESPAKDAAMSSPMPKWHTPSKDDRTCGFDIVHVLDILAKYGWTHADGLIEVRNSSAWFAFGVSLKQASMPRLKFELDAGHPKRLRHDFNGMVGCEKATALLFGRLSATAVAWLLSTCLVASRHKGTSLPQCHKGVYSC